MEELKGWSKCSSWNKNSFVLYALQWIIRVVSRTFKQIRQIIRYYLEWSLSKVSDMHRNITEAHISVSLFHYQQFLKYRVSLKKSTALPQIDFWPYPRSILHFFTVHLLRRPKISSVLLYDDSFRDTFNLPIWYKGKFKFPLWHKIIFNIHELPYGRPLPRITLWQTTKGNLQKIWNAWTVGRTSSCQRLFSIWKCPEIPTI